MTATDEACEAIRSAHPGSRLDAAASAHAQATPDPAQVAAIAAEAAAGQPRYTPLPVVVQPPARTTYKTAVVAIGTYRKILGRNQRRQSVSIACTNGNAIIAGSQEEIAAALALSPNGAGIPSQDFPGAQMPNAAAASPRVINGTEEVWAASTTGSTNPAVLSMIIEWREDA
jgi:hypothetical protein